MNLAGFGDWDWSIQAGDDDESTNDTGLPVSTVVITVLPS